MNRKIVQAWIALSLVTWLLGYIGKAMVAGNEFLVLIYFFGWISAMLAVGYYCKPDHPVFGKIVYGFVILMIVGIIWKILHLVGADEIIIIGLTGIAATYAIMWIRNKKMSAR